MLSYKMVMYMKDIPVFTTDDGVSTLILKEVPYKRTAYVRIQSVQPGGLDRHLQECVSFCRMLDAEHIYAAGHPELEGYPLHCEVLSMSMDVQERNSKAELLPVTAENVAQWRSIYNEKMQSVDNAATMTAADEKKIVSSAGTWFAWEGDTMLGIGWVEGNKILALAKTAPVPGERLVDALLKVCGGTVTVEVASTNVRARKLYDRMGFKQAGVTSRWYTLR